MTIIFASIIPRVTCMSAASERALGEPALMDARHNLHWECRAARPLWSSRFGATLTKQPALKAYLGMITRYLWSRSVFEGARLFPYTRAAYVRQLRTILERLFPAQSSSMNITSVYFAIQASEGCEQFLTKGCIGQECSCVLCSIVSRQTNGTPY